MDDIMEPPDRLLSSVVSVMAEAVDEIERLRAEVSNILAENDALRFALNNTSLHVAAARREGIEAAAKEVDCGCDIRDAVLSRLESKGQKYASYLCQHGDVCCALQAAEIRTLKWEGDK